MRPLCQSLQVEEKYHVPDRSTLFALLRLTTADFPLVALEWAGGPVLVGRFDAPTAGQVPRYVATIGQMKFLPYSFLYLMTNRIDTEQGVFILPTLTIKPNRTALFSPVTNGSRK
jgi:hypothetical protein